MKVLSFLGLKINLKKEIKHLLLSWLISYICIFSIIVIKTLIVGDTLNDVYELAKNLSLVGTIVYGMFCLFQEILFRGILLRWMIRKYNKKYLSIIITTLLFLVCHYGYDIVTIIGALFISIVSSILTIKDDNIYKGFFFHWIVGGIGYIFITLAFL